MAPLVSATADSRSRPGPGLDYALAGSRVFGRHGIRSAAAGDALLAPSVTRRLVSLFAGKLELRDRVNAVIFAYESGLAEHS